MGQENMPGQPDIASNGKTNPCGNQPSPQVAGHSKESQARREEVLRMCSVGLRRILGGLPLDYSELQEIRLRVGQPILLRSQQGECFVGADGSLGTDPVKGYRLPAKELRETLEYVGNYSLYAYEEELRQGYITVQGGHRVGVAGKVVLEQGRIRTMKNISFLHIRLAHEKKGCADPILPLLIAPGGHLYHTLLISPPGCGKTTLLRDLIRSISDGAEPLERGYSVGVVDERSEIAACYLGIPQNDIGCRTDVLDCCPKPEGILMLIRSMAPQVVAVDELGKPEDLEAVLSASASGCRVMATAHGSSVEEVTEKWKRLTGRDDRFERYVVLSRRKGAGTVEQICDAAGRPLPAGKGSWSRCG